MAWLAVTTDGEEWAFDQKPTEVHHNMSYGRKTWTIYDDSFYRNDFNQVQLPYGSIEKLLGYELTFEDSPIELST